MKAMNFSPYLKGGEAPPLTKWKNSWPSCLLSKVGMIIQKILIDIQKILIDIHKILIDIHKILHVRHTLDAPYPF